ncbi:MAG: amidohydrolase family protein, partial [Bacteriovoracia bacterium]
MTCCKKVFSNHIPREQLKEILSVARGEKPANLLLKDINVLDLVNGGTSVTNVAICGEYIAGIGSDYDEAKEVVQLKGLSAVPGFIDSHLHIESSMMNPFQFEKTTLPLGTTTAICDPHEITNVLGEEGFAWFLRASHLMQQNLFVQVSSCVPALKGFETNGAEFTLDEMEKVIDHPHVLGLSEMMNFPGVTLGVDEVLDKLEAFEGMPLDGHAPLAQGKSLNAYLAAGIDNGHETVGLEEAQEKLMKGMSIAIREGTVAKNLDSLAPVINEMNSMQCMLCTDDRNPYEIANQGHINFLVKKLIKEHNIKPHLAYRIASFSAAKHFGLKRLGLIAPGYKAD